MPQILSLTGITRLLLITFIAIAFLIFGRQSFASTTATLYPVSDGNYTDWNPNTGSNHYAVVDEATCNGNTDFNRETVVGKRDSYGINISSVPNGATITQIDITPCVSKNNTGGVNTTFNVFYRLDGVDSADAGSYSLSTTTPTVQSTTSYSGLSVAKSGSTTLEVGGVFTAGNRGARLSQMAVIITYINPPSVTTNAATSVTQSNATLNSTVNPNGASTVANYRYGTSNIGCSSLPNSTSNSNIGSGTSGVSNPQGVASLSANTTYYFCATATNLAGTTYGNVSSFTTLPNAPAAPSNLVVTLSSSTTAELVWQDNSNNETTFRIERSLNGSTGWTQVGSVSANTDFHVNSGLTPLQSYYYRVYATNTGGNSSYTNVYSINTDIPNNPYNLTVQTEQCGGTAVPKVLSWQDNSSNEDSFIIERSPTIVGGPSDDYEFVASVSANVTSYEDLYGECGYRVRAVNSSGNSDWRYTDTIL